MSRSEIAWRSLRDLGLASWFGGSMFGSVALPRPDARLDEVDARSTVQSARRDVETSAWRRWSPVLTASMAAHLIGGSGLLLGRRGRARPEVQPVAVVKAGLTLTAVVLTVGAAAQGYRSETGRTAGGEEQADGELLRRARGERAMRAAGMLIPATTGALVVLDVLEGEQRRRRDAARTAVDQALDAVRGATRRPPAPIRDLVGR